MNFSILEALFKVDGFGRDFFDLAYLDGSKHQCEMIFDGESKCQEQFELFFYGFKIRFIPGVIK